MKEIIISISILGCIKIIDRIYPEFLILAQHDLFGFGT